MCKETKHFVSPHLIGPQLHQLKKRCVDWSISRDLLGADICGELPELSETNAERSTGVPLLSAAESRLYQANSWTTMPMACLDTDFLFSSISSFPSMLFHCFNRASIQYSENERLALSNSVLFNFRFFLSEMKSEVFRQHKQEMLTKMEQYLATTKCRRR